MERSQLSEVDCEVDRAEDWDLEEVAAHGCGEEEDDEDLWFIPDC